MTIPIECQGGGVHGHNFQYFSLISEKQGWGAGKLFSGSGSWYFFLAATAPRGQKKPTPVPDHCKIFFSPQTSKTAKSYNKWNNCKMIFLKMRIPCAYWHFFSNVYWLVSFLDSFWFPWSTIQLIAKSERAHKHF